MDALVAKERRRRTVLAGVLAVALTAAACAGSAGARPPAGGAARTHPEVFTGSVEDFYVVPDPLPRGRAGDLIRVQAIGTAGGRTSVRIMYHSDDATGRDRAVTGVVTYPTSRPPRGGWPVVSTAHGTTGLAPMCAPSRTAREAPGWGVDGVWVMTDYVGLGPVGELHPYLSKAAEGNAVIDAVRAARRLDGSHAGRRWVAVGHSQGGHGALAAHELARERAPELRLVATVALAPGAMMDRVYGGIDPIVTGVLTIMGLVGGASEHPDIDVADYLTPQALEAAKVVETGCLDEITAALVPVVVAGAFVADPRQTEPARSIILANDVGGVAVRGVPLYLASGTADDRVVIDRVRDLFARLCAAGQVTELTVVDGADHGSIIPATADRVTSFLEGALHGTAPLDSCP
jgi:acetyl esterase/lipase